MKRKPNRCSCQIKWRKSLIIIFVATRDVTVRFLWQIFDIFVNIHRFVVPESPRWLLCKGRVSEVKVILKKAAQFNGRELPENLDKYLKPPCNAEESASGVVELFRTKYLRLVTFCFLCIWFTMNLVYYGLILNMNSFGGNFYVNSVSFSCHLFRL